MSLKDVTEVEEPNLLEDLFPHVEVPRIAFDGKIYVGTVGQMNRALCLDAETGAIRWQFWVTGPEYPGGGGAIWTSPAGTGRS